MLTSPGFFFKEANLSYSPLPRCMVRVTNGNSARRFDRQVCLPCHLAGDNDVAAVPCERERITFHHHLGQNLPVKFVADLVNL